MAEDRESSWGQRDRVDNVPRPFIIGVAGGTASGKTSVCTLIMQQLGQDVVADRSRQVAIISEDSFYRNLSESEKEQAERGQFNFDHPDAIDFEKLQTTMLRIREGKRVDVPVYDFINNCHKLGECQSIHPSVDVLLFEGILAFYWANLRSLFNMKLFVDQDADTRLARRVLRDTKECGRDLQMVLHQYTHCVKPAFEEFCLPTKKYADVIIPRGKENEVAINLIVQHIQDLLQPSSSSRLAAARRTRYNSDSAAVHTRPH